MSLLEDVFLEDEAGEAQALERVIEANEYDEFPQATSPNSDDNSAKEDEAEEEKRRVDPTQSKAKRVVKHPRFILNPALLTGPRGIQVIPEHFKDFKFKGKGHEKEDLDLVLKKMEHWAYRLYPKYGFEDCLKKIETLGKKRPVMVHLHKIRNDQLTLTDEQVVDKDSSDEENSPPEQDEFDKLLQQQIELARATPGPSSVKKLVHSPPWQMKTLMMPKATSSPSISEEQKERMMRNKKLAEERRLARLAKENLKNNDESTTDISQGSLNINILNEETALSATVEVVSVEVHDTLNDHHKKVVENNQREIQECDTVDPSNVDLSEKDKELDDSANEEENMDVINNLDEKNGSNEEDSLRSHHDVEMINNKDIEDEIINSVDDDPLERSIEQQTLKHVDMESLNDDFSEEF